MFDVVPSHCIQHKVELCSAVFPVVVFIVNVCIGTETEHKVFVCRRRSACYNSAQVLCQLHGKMTHPSRCCMNKYLLTGLHIGIGDHGLIGCKGSQRCCCGLCMTDVCWF